MSYDNPPPRHRRSTAPRVPGATPENSGKATASMVTGLVGLLTVCCGLFVVSSIVAIVLGRDGAREIAASGGQSPGRRAGPPPASSPASSASCCWSSRSSSSPPASSTPTSTTAPTWAEPRAPARRRRTGSARPRTPPRSGSRRRVSRVTSAASSLRVRPCQRSTSHTSSPSGDHRDQQRDEQVAGERRADVAVGEVVDRPEAAAAGAVERPWRRWGRAPSCRSGGGRAGAGRAWPAEAADREPPARPSGARGSPARRGRRRSVACQWSPRPSRSMTTKTTPAATVMATPTQKTG